MRRLPHRYPFLLVDRVLECIAGESIRALKNVTVNEPFFPGTSRHRPVMPGVIILEALAQAAGILASSPRASYPDENRQLYFVGIDKARFRRPVLPGDQLILKATLERSIRGIWKFSTLAEVDGAGGDQRRDDGRAGGQCPDRRHAIRPALIAPGRPARRRRRGRRLRVVGPGVTIGAGTLDRSARRDRRSDADRPRQPHLPVRLDRRGAAGPEVRGEPTRLEIGDRNTFRENCTINRGTTKDQLVTRIGDDNLFMAGSHVAHDCVVGSHCVFANYATLGGHVEMGDWVHMGGFSGVHQFCKVGAHAFIANNTAVTRDVPPFVMAVGRPAEPHSVNSEGSEAPRLHRRADPQHPRRLPDPVPLAAEAARGNRAAHAARGRAAGELPLVAFLNDSTPRAERVGIVASRWPAEPSPRSRRRRDLGRQSRRHLIEALRARVPGARFAGVAGPRMIAAGCEAWERAEDLAVMGLFEVLPHLPRLLRIRRKLLARVLRSGPDVYVGIDAKEFNLRVAPR